MGQCRKYERLFVLGNATFNQFKCLQDLPVHILQEAVSAFNGRGGFGSQIDNVTLYSPDNYIERKTQGHFAKLPILIGTNRDEGTLFTIPGPLSEVVTLFGFECPAAAVAQSRTSYSTVAYQYSYQGSFPNINVIPDLGVFHTSEIPLVFGTYNLSSTLDSRPAATALQIATSLYIQGAWASFVRDPVNGLRDYGWSLYTNGSSLNILGGNRTFHSIGAARANSTTCEALFPRLA